MRLATRWVRSMFTDTANSALGLVDIQLVKKSRLKDLYELLGEQQFAAPATTPIPEEAQAYLQPSNPRLAELRKLYDGHPAAVHSLWASQNLTQDRLNLQRFRSDGLYVWQKRGVATDAQYAVSASYVAKADRLGLLEKLCEDGAFGCYTVDIDGKAVSRDLLDSIVEINFLDRIFNLSGKPGFRFLDIGAGYGRLAHRVVESLPGVDRVVCTDAVPESTFISEFYLRHRQVDGRARAVPLTGIENVLRGSPVQLATNIHSFSECKLASVTWWLDLLARNRVPYLLIVPNTADRLVTHEGRGVRLDLMPVLEERGYRLVLKEPKYCGSSAAQRYGITPTNYYLFELKA